MSILGKIGPTGQGIAAGVVVVAATAAGVVYYEMRLASPEEAPVASVETEAAPVVAATPATPAPEPSTPPAPIAPTFDVVRFSDDSGLTVAGRGDPQSSVEVQIDGETVSQSKADGAGQFVALVDLMASPEPRLVSLRMTTQSGEVILSDGVVILEATASTALASLDPAPAPIPEPAANPEPVPADDIPAEVVSETPTEEQVIAKVEGPEPAANPEPVPADDSPTEVVSETPTEEQVIAKAEGPETGATPATEQTASTAIEPVEVAETAEAVEVAEQNVENTLKAPTEVVAAAEPTPEPVETEIQPDLPAPVSEPEFAAAAIDVPAPQASGDQPEQEDTQLAVAPVVDAQLPSVTAPETTETASIVAPVTEEAPQEAASAAPSVTANADPAPVAAVVPEAQDTAPESAQVPAVEERAPAVILADSSGARVLTQSTQSQALAENVVISSISYGEDGEVSLSGQGSAGSFVRLYVNNSEVATAPIGTDGTWSSRGASIAPGLYTLRVDQLDAAGAVTSRFETPFQREAPEALERADGLKARKTGTGVAVVTVQPGFTLWAIARENYGDGVQYVAVYEANRAQIRDPDLIYPGQVFQVPDAE